MSVSIEFLKYLEQKLKTGNRSSIHLNVLPQNYATRLDFAALNLIQKNKSGKTILADPNDNLEELTTDFLELLHNKASFKFNINLFDLQKKNIDENNKIRIDNLCKRLDSICYQNIDTYLESGVKSFGFGYPILVKREKKNPDRVIKAPLLIWKLDIEKSSKRPYVWDIKKEEDFPIAVNEVLVSQLNSDEGIVLEAIPAEFLEDNIIQKEELLTLCNTVLSQLGNENPLTETDIKLEKCPSVKKAEENSEFISYIHWAGVFGIFKSQKQSIIREIDNLITNYSKFDFNKTHKIDFHSKVSGVETDPSQERIINHFNESEVKVIQGPPGTGKSQTISAIITNALENQKKCLVICEKKTAIEVIFNNLDKLGIGGLCAVIDDINKDRAKIIESARSKMQITAQRDYQEHVYSSTLEMYEKRKEEINERLSSLRKKCFGDYNHKQAVGIFLENQIIESADFLKEKLHTEDYNFSYEEYSEINTIVNKALDLINDANATASGLNLIEEDVFQKEDAENEKERILHDIKELFEITKTLSNNLELFNNISTEFYNKKSWFTKFSSGSLSVFSKKHKKIHRAGKAIWKNYITLNSKFQFISFLRFDLKNYDEFHFYNDLKEYVSVLFKKLHKIIIDYDKYDQFREWKQYLHSLKSNQRSLILSLCETEEQKRLAAFKSWYLNEVLQKYYISEDIKIENGEIKSFDELTVLLKKIQKDKILTYWQKQQSSSIENFKDSASSLKRLYNYRKNKNFGRKNALRKIINADFELFSNFFPVILTNPVACSSVLPMEPGLFDVVIFDEASQLRVEDTFSSYLRGKYKVISGDRHQMPPSNYFQGGPVINYDDDMDEETEDSLYLAESESLLEFVEENTLEQTYLSFHYRSQHPYLIDFSNAAFYGNRLIPMPAVKRYKPIRLVNVEGIYNNSVNEKEAGRVVRILSSEIKADKEGNYPSVGIATTNIYQRNLIWEKIRERSYEDNEFAKKFALLNSNNFFVKNLENIQGDERDIIIISTTFGLDEEGKFRQNFGPINREKGYRLLNVIITRAKQQVYICTSIPRAVYSDFRTLIEEKGNTGRGVFYAYLSYAETIEQGNETARENILSLLSANCKEAFKSRTSKFIASPFEKSIEKYLSEHINPERITLMYRFGGFIIDIHIKPKTKRHKPIAIDCNGGQYFEGSESYNQLIYRKKQLEGYGFKYINLWSWRFWRNPEKELENLLKVVD